MRRTSMLLLSARCGALLPLTRCAGRRRLALRAETIAAETDAVEYVVKRSRFVAHAAPCTSFDEAEGFVAAACAADSIVIAAGCVGVPLLLLFTDLTRQRDAEFCPEGRFSSRAFALSRTGFRDGSSRKTRGLAALS